MRYTITEFDIFNAIIHVGQKNKSLWDNANDCLLEIETRLEYKEELMNKVKNYLKEKHNLIRINITNDNILDVWYDYYYDLYELINNYK